MDKIRIKGKTSNIQITASTDSNKSNNSDNLNGAENPLFSLLDNRGTPMQFCPDEKGSKLQKDGFSTVYYRKKNLTIANALANCKYKDNESVKKIIKGLRSCSSLSIVECDSNLNGSVLKTTKKCKRALCANCNRIAANKYRSRFIKAFTSDQYRALFTNKYFYFLTFTLKHNSKVRNEVYLEELKGYITELRRSKIWKKYFPYSKKKQSSGWVQSYELTITDNGFNIHSHAFMCCPRISVSLKQIRKELSAKWLQLTKDSHNLRFDFLKLTNEDISNVKNGIVSNGFNKAISETFKYTVKVGNLQFFKGAKVDLLAEWIIATKGKNMVTSNGFFRDMQLFTRKSRLDTKAPVLELNPNSKFFTGPTSQIKFNKSTTKEYTKKIKKAVLESVFLKEISPRFVNISGVINEFLKYMILDVTDKEIMEELDNWIHSATTLKNEKDYLDSFNTSEKELEIAIEEHVTKQLKLFNANDIDIKNIPNLSENW